MQKHSLCKTFYHYSSSCIFIRYESQKSYGIVSSQALQVLIIFSYSFIKLSIGFFLLRLADRTKWRPFLIGMLSKCVHCQAVADV